MATTIKDICSEILKLDASGKFNKHNRHYVTEGLAPRDLPNKSGLVQLTPNQCLNVIVETVYLNGKVGGYQRRLSVEHARKIARAMQAGKDVGEATLGSDNGRVFATDGQHRLIAAVIARKPIWAVIRPMTEPVRAERFVSQVYARRVGADTVTLASDNKVSNYIRDAIAARENGLTHPWAPLVGMKASSQTMSPHAAFNALSLYATGAKTQTALKAFGTERIDREFKDRFGAELADLFLTFGTKSTNPLAFRPASITAITLAAIDIIVRGGRRPDDFARWHKHMQSFDWAGFAWLRNARELEDQLVKHWNKRLSAARKVKL